MNDHELNSDGAPRRDDAVAERRSEPFFFDLLVVLVKHKFIVIGVTVLSALLSVVYALILPVMYASTTKMLPPQQGQSASSAILAQLGGLAGISGGGIRSSTDLYVSMLRSRSVADGIISRFDLGKTYKSESRQAARDTLESRSNFSVGKQDGVIAVQVEDQDPKLAAEIANAYVGELLKFTSGFALTEASQRRLFYERQLSQAKDNLVRAEIAARQALQQRGLVKVDDQGKAMVETAARLRAQIVAKEVQIGAMRTFAADGNPDLKMALQELASLKREAARIEGSGDARNFSDSSSNTKTTESIGLLRDVKYFETTFELLTKQHELAKLDEAKDPVLIQVIESAIPAERRSRPKRTPIVVLAVFAGFFVGVIAALIRESLQRVRSDPTWLSRWRQLSNTSRQN